MTIRTTRRDLDAALERICRVLCTNAYYLEWSGDPQRPRLYLRIDEHGAAREISPRLPTGPMYDWLHAYLDGIDAGIQSARKEDI